MTKHTRASTGAGPDYCVECSERDQTWIKWPCPASEVQDENAALRACVQRLADGWHADPSEVVGNAWYLTQYDILLDIEAVVMTGPEAAVMREVLDR